jgi:outer membrane biosynthesis protein TonB
MLQKVTFIKKSIFGDKGEERDVTEKAAVQYAKLGLIKPLVDIGTKEEIPEVKEEINTQTKEEIPEEKPEQKEEKSEPETKEEKEVPETKEEKQDSREVMGTKKVPKKEEKKVKITKAPKL